MSEFPINQLRPKVKGKFLVVDGEKFYVRGVTYGTFQPNQDGENYPEPAVVVKDFALMNSFGINSVRTYTIPPRYLLDSARENNLKVLVGLPWEQHINFLDDSNRVREIEQKVCQGIRACANHPAVLAYTLGNEIPAPIVRWYGNRRIENFLKQLYKAGKQTDAEALFTYVNYPTTEYLRLPFLDFDCFNVYLESKEKLEPYLARLHNLSGDKPLVMAEIGLDSNRNGEEKQAESLEWQIRSVFSSGGAGAYVFAWTDEWWRGGFDIEDWDFGLTTRERKPKAALSSVAKAFQETPFPKTVPLPKISVVVCSYNGASTIRECFEALLKVDYPNFEVIVVNDGSTNDTAQIAGEYPFRLISTPNRGLSSARNTGMLAATGDIVAFIDDDAYPDPHWLQYLAHSFTTSEHAGIGGPNIPSPGDGMIAESVANAPGGPAHVLLTDDLAEHIPGCNMAFRRDALLEVGGFDSVFRVAGDDVDLCWKIQAAGKTIAFHPAAIVWHHRRNSVKAYWKQQKGYGKAEALLEEKWTQKYNSFGHATWNGKIYGNGLTLPLQLEKDKIFHGTWGTALFQSIYQPANSIITCLPLMPEWYFVVAGLAVLSLLGFLWQPLFFALPLLIASAAVVLVQAGVSAAKAVYATAPKTGSEKFYRLSLTAFLHVIQPIARLYGRLAHGLTLWGNLRVNDLPFGFLVPKKRNFSIWSEEWKSSDEWLVAIETGLIESKTKVRRGGDFDRFDLEVNVGMFAVGRGILVTEEHGAGKQLIRLGCRARYSMIGIALFTVFSALALFAGFDNSFVAATILSAFSILIGFAMITEGANAVKNLSLAFLELNRAAIQKTDEAAVELIPDFESAKPFVVDSRRSFEKGGFK
ncbi:MAG: glycosyltransferase [Acidobacteriota bacterium]|nr:glycosyltransferase [Acidobacteriota bacterium]